MFSIVLANSVVFLFMYIRKRRRKSAFNDIFHSLLTMSMKKYNQGIKNNQIFPYKILKESIQICGIASDYYFPFCISLVEKNDNVKDKTLYSLVDYFQDIDDSLLLFETDTHNILLNKVSIINFHYISNFLSFFFNSFYNENVVFASNLFYSMNNFVSLLLVPPL